MATDNFAQQATALNSPSARAAAVTPNNSVDLTEVTRALYIGGAGDVKVDIGATAITFVGVAAGSLLPIRVTRVYATGTTASSIVALY
jgi:hypothetical protein